jgi:competence protein ComFC
LHEAGLRLLALLLPPVCVACNRIEGTRSLELGLCSFCRLNLEPIPDSACAGCCRPLEAIPLPDGYLCGPCRLDPPPFLRLHSGWSYEPPLVEVIHALKFRRLAFLGVGIGRVLGRHKRGLLQDVDLVVPVPLHWRRQMSRGFNQAEEIARPIAKELGVPMVRALRRGKATRPQTGLDRAARAANLSRAFTLTRMGSRRLQASTVLLVDDVVTTRNTLGAAARQLLDSGAASSVICLTAGRTAGPL